MIIYHISNQLDWDQARGAGVYHADSLASEGFIHCSTSEQVLVTAGRFYPGRQDLLLLAIESDLLSAPLAYENLEGGSNLYPHIYGALNLSAVISATPFPASADGSFRFPND